MELRQIPRASFMVGVQTDGRLEDVIVNMVATRLRTSSDAVEVNTATDFVPAGLKVMRGRVATLMHVVSHGERLIVTVMPCEPIDPVPGDLWLICREIHEVLKVTPGVSDLHWGMDCYSAPEQTAPEVESPDELPWNFPLNG